MASSAEQSAPLEYTPTWIVALVCFVIVFVSLFMERLLHYLGKILKSTGQESLFQALQKLKEELMLLGFISLLLSVFQNLISHICIPASITNHMLPCKRPEGSTPQHEIYNRRRLLAEHANSSHCSQGKVPLLSLESLHQLHIFIFVLAVVHLVFCAITVVLGGAKIKRWQHWEKHENLEPTATRAHHSHVHHQFKKSRTGFWTRSTITSSIMAFFKQFHASVTKSDYICLRYGFVMKHCPSNPKFDFHKYLLRTLEADFKKVVGISWYMWLFVVIFLLLDVAGWHTFFWLSFLPLALLLIVGTKLEHIITRLADDAPVKAGNGEDEAPTVKPSDVYFWFQSPLIVLYLVHFILFQNSFEIAFFIWILFTYGFDSCIMESKVYVIPRLIIGVIIQVLCSYSTLPLYTLVTQMGDRFKETIFDKQMQMALRGWAENTRRPKKAGGPFLSHLVKGFGWRRNKNNTLDVQIEMQRIESDMVHSEGHSISLEEVMASITECSNATHRPT